MEEKVLIELYFFEGKGGFYRTVSEAKNTKEEKEKKKNVRK